jgi:hypothetical protein
MSAAFEPTQSGIEDLDGARHLQRHHGVLDPVSERGHDLG